MRVVFFGRDGKVGRAIAPRLEAAGHELVELEEAEVAVDFTRPDAVAGTAERCLAQGTQMVIGTTGFDRDRVDALARRSRGGGVPCAELRARRGADDAFRRRGRRAAAEGRDRRAPQRGEGRRTLGHGSRNRRRDGHVACDPLRPPARARRTPGGASRRGGGAAHDPARHVRRARRSRPECCSRSSASARSRRASPWGSRRCSGTERRTHPKPPPTHGGGEGYGTRTRVSVTVSCRFAPGRTIDPCSARS